MRSSRTRSIVVALTIVATVLIPASPAYACDCMELDRATILDDLDSAFVGIAREVISTSPEGYNAVVRFEVVDEIKGQAQAEAHLVVKAEDDSCGTPAFTTGGSFFERKALIQVYNGHRVAEVCTIVSPDVLDEVPRQDYPIAGNAVPATLNDLFDIDPEIRGFEAAADANEAPLDPSSAKWPLTVGAVAVLLALSGLIWARSRKR